MDLFTEHNGHIVLDKSAGYSYQQLKPRNSNRTNPKPIIAMCNDYGYSVIGSNLSLDIILIATHEMIHTMGVDHDGYPGSQLAADCDDGVHLLSSILGATNSDDAYAAKYFWYFSNCTIMQLRTNLLDEGQQNG
jgi:hypothetical protein